MPPNVEGQTSIFQILHRAASCGSPIKQSITAVPQMHCNPGSRPAGTDRKLCSFFLAVECNPFVTWWLGAREQIVRLELPSSSWWESLHAQIAGGGGQVDAGGARGR